MANDVTDHADVDKGKLLYFFSFDLIWNLKCLTTNVLSLIEINKKRILIHVTVKVKYVSTV